MLTTSTRHGFQTTYPCILGRIVCPEERWKLQRLVKVVEYLAAPLDYLRLSHWSWRHSGRVLCAFISEGRMLPMLERLDPTAYKRNDYMITSDSFIFSNEQWLSGCSQLARHQVLYSTSSLGLGGPQKFFLGGEIRSFQHETRIFSTRLLCPMDHKPSTRLGSQDGVLIHNPRQRRVWWNSERGQG